MSENAYVGIDIAKSEYVVCLLLETGSPVKKTFSNTASGHLWLVKWVKKKAPEAKVHYCMESTGCYHLSLATYLAEDGQLVSVVEPRRIKYFGIGIGMKNKTDKADAEVIARYAKIQNPQPWILADPVRREIHYLTTRVRQLAKMKNQESNRLENSHLPKLIRTQIESLLESIAAQVKEIEERIASLLPESGQMQTVVNALIKVKGIGLKTALTFAVYIDVTQYDDAKDVAVMAGLNPRRQESGQYVGKSRISKAGHAELRTDFYFPTMTAMKFLTSLKELKERLEKKGLTKKQVNIACERKLLMICYGIAKNALAEKEIYGYDPVAEEKLKAQKTSEAGADFDENKKSA